MQEIKYSDITFVIPTNRDYIRTLESIPKECSIIICREYTQGKARNEGVKKSKTEWIVFADDDIKFTREFFTYVLQLAENNPDTIIGLQGYMPSIWLISRFMLFKKSIFDTVGYLKEVRHGEETEWEIRAEKKGYKLIAIPRESVYHFPHEKGKFKNEIKNIFWLLYLHPDLIIRTIKKIINKIIKSSDDIEYRYHNL